jgi:hypothetical protein
MFTPNVIGYEAGQRNPQVGLFEYSSDLVALKRFGVVAPMIFQVNGTLQVLAFSAIVQFAAPRESVAEAPPAVTLILVHGLQLFASLDSVTTPVLPPLVLSAQARIEYIPATPKVMAGEVAVPLAPLASGDIVKAGALSVIVPVPLISAVWKITPNCEPVGVLPIFEIVDVYGVGTLIIAVFGAGANATRSGNATETVTVADAGELVPFTLLHVIVYVYVLI